MVNVLGETVKMTDKFAKAVAFQSFMSGVSPQTCLWLASIIKHKELYKQLHNAGCAWDGSEWHLSTQSRPQ